MNYQKHYNILIERARTRTLPENIYIEHHHIIPKCTGGSNNKSNIVKLTAEEHYVAHQLLVKIYPNEKGLVYAVSMMTCGSHKNHRNTNKSYGWLRRKFSAARKGFKHSEESKLKMSIAHTGKKLSKEHKQKISEIQKGKKGTPLSVDHKEKLRKANLGKKASDKTKEKIRQSSIGRKHSLETKFKISQANKGKKISKKTKELISKNHANVSGKNNPMYGIRGKDNPNFGLKRSEETRAKMSKAAKKHIGIKIKCNHCGKIGDNRIMKRWHFDNCKQNPNNVIPQTNAPHNT